MELQKTGQGLAFKLEHDTFPGLFIPKVYWSENWERVFFLLLGFGKLPSPAAKLEINITRFMVLDPSLKEMNSQIKPSNNKLTPQPT